MPVFECFNCGNKYELNKNPHELSNELVHLSNVIGEYPSSCDECLERIESEWKREFN